MFWINFNYGRIVRGQGIEMPSTYTNLVTSDISCAGMHSLIQMHHASVTLSTSL